MFEEQEGFIDVFFGEGTDDHVTVTLRKDEQSRRWNGPLRTVRLSPPSTLRDY